MSFFANILKAPPLEVLMFQSQSPPLVENEWEIAERTSSGRRARDRDTGFDQRINLPPKSIHSSHSSRHEDDQVASDRPSIGRRIFRTITRFFIAVFIGVGATLAWQSYGDAAREMVATRVPTLAWLLSLSETKSPVAAAVSSDPVQQLEPLASNLDLVRRNVEQLAAKQDQMAQNIAVLLAVEEDVRQKISITPPAPAQQAASNPQPKPAQPRTQPSLVSHGPPAGSLSR
jgi:hypothetical protein